MGAPRFTDAATHTEVHGPKIDDLANAGTAFDQAKAQAQVDALNAILAALRSANIISTS